MNRSRITALVAGSLMAVSAVAATYLTPTQHMSESRPGVLLDQMIPARFGDWTEEKIAATAVVDPQIADQLRRIYTQIVNRTYVNSRGDRIMLSIAYGTDQSDNSQVHYPEVCYPAQGFRVTSTERGTLSLGQGAVPVKRLETNLQNQRYEPVTYWTTVGNKAVTTSIDKKMAEMRYGFSGTVPDGLLFRVSSIDRDAAKAFTVHEEFVRAMAGVLDSTARERLMGIAQ
jgi:EpsI family protein